MTIWALQFPTNKLMTKTIDESWERYPEARIRMRENGLKTILEGLGENGFCASAMPRINLVDDGIYVEILLNVGKHGSIIALPLEVFIPVPAKLLAPPPKKPAKEKKTNAAKSPPPIEPVAAIEPVADELCEPATTAGSTS